MSAQAPAPTNHAELVSTANNLWARTRSAAHVASTVAEALPTNFEPASGRTNLGLCCRMIQWILLEIGSSLQQIKDSGRDESSLVPDSYARICDDQRQRLLACLATAMAICDLLKTTRFHDERLLLAGILPDLDEQIAILAAIRTAAEPSHADKPGRRTKTSDEPTIRRGRLS